MNPTPSPPPPVAVAFIDGQNLFHAAKREFGYHFPNYDPFKLAGHVCKEQGWQLASVRFYTGMPNIADDRFWHIFWNNKAAAMKRRGVEVYTRLTRPRSKDVTLNGTETIHPPGAAAPLPAGTKLHLANGDEVLAGTLLRVKVAVEKGIDVLIAVDMLRAAFTGGHDVLILFSQDQDLAEAVSGVMQVARGQGRHVIVASAFPDGGGGRGGVNMTRAIPIGKAEYDACIDPADYRPKP